MIENLFNFIITPPLYCHRSTRSIICGSKRKLDEFNEDILYYNEEIYGLLLDDDRHSRIGLARRSIRQMNT